MNNQDKNVWTSDCPAIKLCREMKFTKATEKEYSDLAAVLSGFSEGMEKVLQVLISKRLSPDDQGGYAIKDVINLAYACDQAVLAYGISNDEQLGQFVIDYELNEELDGLTKNVLDLIDRKKLGQLQREKEDGVIMDNCYIATGMVVVKEIYGEMGNEAAAKDKERIRRITVDELSKMSDREGLIFRGCGGELEEWLEGVNRILTEDKILLSGDRFEHCYVFQHNGETNILFLFEDQRIHVGRLAIWRISTYPAFGGTWLSDYLENNGLIKREEAEQEMC
jgi:hypothetical protein